jgi:hypothetical protein
MLKASSSTVGWFLTVDYLIGPILGFLILVVFPFLVIRSTSQENKAAEFRRAVSLEVDKKLASMGVSSDRINGTPIPKVSTNAPDSNRSDQGQEKSVKKQLEAQKIEFERQKLLIDTAHLLELENLDVAHQRELSIAVEKASQEVAESIAKSHAEDAKRIQLSKQEAARKNLALVAKFLSSSGLPSWDTYRASLEFLGGTPKFPLLTKEMSAGLIDPATEPDLATYKGIINLCHHLAGVYLSSEEISIQEKLHFLTNCRWQLTPPQKLQGEAIQQLGQLSMAPDPTNRVIEAFSENFERTAKVMAATSTVSKLREFSICINCGSEIELGRTRCREACGYS